MTGGNNFTQVSDGISSARFAGASHVAGAGRRIQFGCQVAEPIGIQHSRYADLGRYGRRGVSTHPHFNVFIHDDHASGREVGDPPLQLEANSAGRYFTSIVRSWLS